MEIFDIVFIIFGLIGIALIAAAYIIGIYKYRNCKIPVKAVCVKIKKQKIKQDGRQDYHSTFVPVYQYVFNGKTRTVTESVATQDPGIETGQECELFIDPNNPKIFLVSGKKKGEFWGLALPGIVFFVISAAACVMVHIG